MATTWQGTEATRWKAAASYIAHNPVLSKSLDCLSNNFFQRARPKLISAAIRCFVMQRFDRMCYADATSRVLKEQSMVVRRTETKEFGLASGWSEEDGTTTTYQPFARTLASHRRIETRPVPRSVQQRAAAPANLYTRRPSGVQPKVATPSLDEYEMLELDDLDLRGNPFAPRRSAASASVWNVLGFAALFASVLVGRVIVEAGQGHPRSSKHAAAEAPQQALDSKVAVDAAKAAAPGAEATSVNDNAADSGEAAGSVDYTAGAKPAAAGHASGATDATKAEASGAHAAGATPALSDSAASSGAARSSAEGSKTEQSGAARRSGRGEAAASDRTSDSQPTAAEPTSRTRAAHASQPRASSAGIVEPAHTSAARDRTRDSATGAQKRTASTDWRDGPMEPATTSTRAPSSGWRDGPMEPVTSSIAPPSASSASAAANGTLRINSRPWSQVFIDGRSIGNTPQMSVSVPAGRHTVRLTNPELGMSKTIIVQVAAGELVTRVESLE